MFHLPVSGLVFLQRLLPVVLFATLVSTSLQARAGYPVLELAKSDRTPHGWNWGTRLSDTVVGYYLPETAGDLLIQVQAHNIQNAQVSLLVNEHALGYLDRSPAAGRLTSKVLWLVPKSVLRERRNLLRFRNKRSGSEWGIREITVFDLGSPRSAFGNMSSAASAHPFGFRLHVPEVAGARSLITRFFNTPHRADVAVSVNGALRLRSQRTARDQWSSGLRVSLDPNRHNVVDVVHLVNRNKRPKPLQRWGASFIRVVTAGTSGDATSGTTDTPKPPAHTEPVKPLPGLPTIAESAWDETAVRKVLHAFAFGGHATAAQINAWANMPPRSAISQMLTFDEHNQRLSPIDVAQGDRLHLRSGTFRGMAAYLASGASGIPAEQRRNFGEARGNLGRVWATGTLLRGFNPFRQRMGLWETNYHMAVNKEAGVTGEQMVTYYDSIMAEHASGSPYQKVIGTAARSAAVARQYRHYKNQWRETWCKCNEDFAREFYQLFFGILGKDNSEYHETVTIKNMAHALTDMDIPWKRNEDGSQMMTDQVTFGTKYHYPWSLELMGHQTAGPVAKNRIDTIADAAITHPESEASIPVMIVEALADDNLNTNAKSRLGVAWASMDHKDVLRFVRNYAVSTLFHNKNRIKRWSSVERNMIVTSRLVLNNNEAYLNLYHPVSNFLREDVDLFTPRHNVFGGQTGVEAAASADIFMQNYNLSTKDFWRIHAAHGGSNGRQWEKNWASVVPVGADGKYRIKDVAETLWNYFLADGLKNFGPLARAQVYSLLEGNLNLQYRVNPDDLHRVFSNAEVAQDPTISALVKDLGETIIELRDSDRDVRRAANGRVGSAINFIVATPFIFAQEGQ